MPGGHQVTGRDGHDNLPGYRRWGFESVRKGSRTSDARLRSFEKRLFCCKLTVASDIWKGLLHVSFGAVGNWNFSMLKNAFLYQVTLHELKKFAFSAKQKFSIYRKLYKLHSKPLFYAQKPLLHVPFFAVRKKSHFHKPKVFLLQKALRTVLKSCLFYVQKAFYSHKTFLNCHPKQLFFTLRRPFQRSLTYCLRRIQLFF